MRRTRSSPSLFDNGDGSAGSASGFNVSSNTISSYCTKASLGFKHAHDAAENRSKIYKGMSFIFDNFSWLNYEKFYISQNAFNVIFSPLTGCVKVMLSAWR